MLYIMHAIDHHINDRNKYLDIKGYPKVILVINLSKLAEEDPYNFCK